MKMSRIYVCAVAAFLFFAAPAIAAGYTWPVVQVVDGDTVKVDASPDMPPELASVAVRLHAFQKKARRGIATPKRELDLVRHAELHYRDTHRGG